LSGKERTRPRQPHGCKPKYLRKIIPLRFQAFSRYQSFLATALGKIDIRPTGESILLVAHALAMP
jgi:hypothetical protein